MSNFSQNEDVTVKLNTRPQEPGPRQLSCTLKAQTSQRVREQTENQGIVLGGGLLRGSEGAVLKASWLLRSSRCAQSVSAPQGEREQPLKQVTSSSPRSKTESKKTPKKVENQSMLTTPNPQIDSSFTTEQSLRQDVHAQVKGTIEAAAAKKQSLAFSVLGEVRTITESVVEFLIACKDHSVCTFTGPSVVDTSGKVGTIMDLCDYHLLSSTLLADFSVEAEYKDRRRKDVSFVNTVRIKKGSATYRMEQGGVFKDKDGEVTLTSTSKTVGDLSVSKDDKGLTASYTSKGVIIIIIFDGYTVLIIITGTGRIMGLRRVEGFMCQSRFSYLQACQRQFCSFNPFLCLSPLSNSCGVLTKAPFDSCHSHIAAAGYVKACENTLCVYPAVDNLLCHFLEAYASACSSFTSKSVDAATPKALCHGISCASEEFCGEKEHTGGWDCFCRPVYTAEYRKSKTLGNATQCKDNVASASLINCLLREKGIDYSTLHLKDATCKGTLVDGLLNFEFSSAKMCGAEVTNGADEVVYKNSIKSTDTSGDIIRQDEVNIDFSCNHQQPAIKTVSFKIKSR
ncbi:uncharacterized protein LOC117808825 [Xyrichtys novacula]|uniref:Uncharacterized protein LOC117808825 n=1 Tax=Xyrichtys novacula TaxID=13765 RepID=A0AAV1EMT3_XYRNO|nr:uncharacterized protein LOC117808825 [Xyrichtys novacula]